MHYSVFTQFAENRMIRDISRNRQSPPISKRLFGFLENMLKAKYLNPNHPRITYNPAIACVLNGKEIEAMSNLNKLAEMKLFYQIEKDRHFASLITKPEFQKISAKMKVNLEPSELAKNAFLVTEKGLVAESVAYEAKRKNFFLASIAKRKILKIGENGKTTVFADQTSELWSVSGIKVDEKRQILWAASTANKQMPDIKSEENGASGIFKFDLQTGKLIKKYIIFDKAKEHWLGDLTISFNGDVFATDSVSAAVYVIRKEEDKLKFFCADSNFSSPQGLDITPDGKFLLMADYAKGIFKINIQTKEVAKLLSPENTTLQGIDGIYLYKNTLIAVQNGVYPQRVARIYLNDNLDKVLNYQILEMNNPVFDEITLGVLIADEFYFIANSQWNLLEEGGKFKNPENLTEVSVMKLKIENQ